MNANLNEFISTLEKLIESNRYLEAKAFVIKEFENWDAEVNDGMLLVEIAGYLIDIGEQLWEIELVEKGTIILEVNKEYFSQFVTEDSYYYCLANGKHTIHRIKSYDQPLTLSLITPFLLDAKNYYYKAYKTINYSELNDMHQSILTNLGNNLAQVGRLTEALNFYKFVIDTNPNHPQSLTGRAENLHCWIMSSHPTQSLALFVTIYKEIDRALNMGAWPERAKLIYTPLRDAYKEILITRFNYDLSKIDLDIKTSFEEYSTHTDFRKFCIDNNFSLNEHALYCPCIAASDDDLQIGHPNVVLKMKKIPKMEILLNRIKSEFHLARVLLYEGLYDLPSENPVVYAELHDSECLGEYSEKLRTSFKLCFGILDKIAHGLCFFFDLKENPKESIYFESFWKNPKKPERWDSIKDKTNPHLIALYSIANDLNSSLGEFGFYKQWRNILEHKILILRDAGNDLDLLRIFDDESFVVEIPLNYFIEQVFHLLQLTRSAIFSYTYCIRFESIADDGNIEQAFPVKSKRF